MSELGSIHRLLLLLASATVAVPSAASALTPGERTLTSAPRILLGAEPEEGFGEVLANPGDITGDGIGDLLVGAPAAREGSGRVYLFSGADILGGAALRASEAWAVINGEPGWAYGSEIAVLGDVDGDGWPDWGVGAPTAPGGDAPPGRMWVISGRRTVADGPVGELAFSDSLVVIDGPGESAMMGEGFGPAGDLNGDGLADFAVLHREADTGNDGGSLHVVLGRARGNWPSSVALSSVSSWSYSLQGLGDPGLGFTLHDLVVPAGDRDGDGVGDLFLGLPAFTASGAGASARTGAVLLLPGLEPGGREDAVSVALAQVVASTNLLGTTEVIDAHFGQPIEVLASVGGQTLWVGSEGPDRGRATGLAISGITLDPSTAISLVAGTGVVGAPRLARADLDGNGITGLLAATPRLGEAPGTPGFGRVHVMAEEISGETEITASVASFVGGDEFAAGVSLIAANMDGDAYDDAFVGAPGAFVVGAVFVLVGEELADGDGVAPSEGDCDDGAATVFPGALEIGDCADNLDNDCNGLVDEADDPCALEGSGIVVACSSSGRSGGGLMAAMALLAVLGLRRRGWAAGIVGLLGVAALSGCVSGPTATDVPPAISIVSPLDEERLAETSLLPVVVSVEGVRLAAELAGEEPGEPGVDDPKLPQGALWALIVDGQFRSTDGGAVQVAGGLTPGVHIVRVELRDTADQPLVPEVSAEISVEIVAGEPSLVLTSPAEDAVVSPAGFEVRYDVGGFLLNTASIGAPNQLGVGHAVVLIDDVTVATDGDGRVFVTGISAGEHSLVVELVNNDGSSLDPAVLSEVTVNVAEPEITLISPTEGQTLTGPNIVIEYEVSNFTLDPVNVNDNPQAGFGHTHMYLDGLYQGLDASGTFPIPGVSGCEHTVRLELAQGGHAELGIGLEADFLLEPCIGVDVLSPGDTVSGPQITIPFLSPGHEIDGTLPALGGNYVTQYVDGNYVGFSSTAGNATFTGVTPGAHVFELRLAEGPVTPGSEQSGELSPLVLTTISLTVQ